ncbi:MAG: ATP-dependent endonuclease [Gammaproteobacteria bacterium]|nr:MAG: ATP-dependent endonuclease [Gammaproteobacteria bacterium]
MYLSELSISNFRCFGETPEVIRFNPGLTALVGENDSGKTALIDAVRYALGTSDLEWIRVQETDFHNASTSNSINIKCSFDALTKPDESAFLEYLTYEDLPEGGKKAVLHVNWSARQHEAGGSSARSFVKTEIRSGKESDGPFLDQEVRELLRATYLQPLRDADAAMSSGRGSRLSKILQNIDSIKTGKENYSDGDDIKTLSISGIASLADDLLQQHAGIKAATESIDAGLTNKLSLNQENLKSNIDVSASADSDRRLRQMLEKLSVQVTREGTNEFGLGLGTKNILYIACELLLLEQGSTGNRMLLIEEPEAHIHAQRQLKILKSLQHEAKAKGIQVFVSTHSPLLASVVKLENIIYVQGAKAYSMAEKETKLSKSDYSFLERFLDATKSNLFFAKGIVIVEGDAENILLPTIARSLGRDFTDYGVSIVNVGGIGLRRYANIFQRADEEDGLMDIPVACITDIDVMPDCAPVICINGVTSDDSSTWPPNRRWKTISDFQPAELQVRRKEIEEKANGQAVKTFVAEHWTLEYALSHAGLAREVYVAAKQAIKDAADLPKGKSMEAVTADAGNYYSAVIAKLSGQELIASTVYSEFTTGTKASKAISAQYLAAILEARFTGKPGEMKSVLPEYLIHAIEYVTEPLSTPNKD